MREVLPRVMQFVELWRGTVPSIPSIPSMRTPTVWFHGKSSVATSDVSSGSTRRPRIRHRRHSLLSFPPQCVAHLLEACSGQGGVQGQGAIKTPERLIGSIQVVQRRAHVGMDLRVGFAVLSQGLI